MSPVVILDYVVPDFGIEKAILELERSNLVLLKNKDEPDLVRAVVDADCVILQMAEVTSKATASMGKVWAIVRCGIGADNIDLAAAGERNISVCTVPDYCTEATKNMVGAQSMAATKPGVIITNVCRGTLIETSEPIAALESAHVAGAGFDATFSEPPPARHPLRLMKMEYWPATWVGAVSRP